MTKSNSKGDFEPSVLETIHSEENTPQGSASHEELLAPLQAASDAGKLSYHTHYSESKLGNANIIIVFFIIIKI